jgi:hypothetical protein
MSAADRSQTLDGSEDFATAETVLPVAPDLVASVLEDVELLFRLNPQMAIERWEPVAGGFRVGAHNDSNGRDVDTAILVERAAGILRLRYGFGLKRETRFTAESHAGGVKLVVTEHYPRIEDPQDPRVVHVDRSLVPWVAAIRRHLLGRMRWGWLPGWRWWQERVMLSMVPRSRRIVRLLMWITALEFAVFLAAVVVLRFAA